MSEINNQTNKPENSAFEVIDWTKVSPYPSLRLFELEGSDKKWTEKALGYALDLSGSIEEIVQQYPPISRGKKRVKQMAAPADVTPINPIFYDLNAKEFDKGTFELDAEKPKVPEKFVEQLTPNHIFLTAAWFRMSGSPSWLKEKFLEDIRHHLLIMAVLPPYVVVTCTFHPLHMLVSELLEDGQQDKIHLPEPAFPVKKTIIEDTFVRGKAYQLWLSGLHRSVETKADKKKFSGQDVRYVLDPFEEQTFAYSTIISDFPDPDETKADTDKTNKDSPASVGYSRSTHTVWVPKTKGIPEFSKLIALFRKMLMQVDPARKKVSKALKEKIKKERQGLSYLSDPIGAAAIAQAKEPFEISLDFDDPVPQGQSSNADIEKEMWRDHGRLEFDFNAPDSPCAVLENSDDHMYLPVKALFKNKFICRFCLELSRSVEDEITVSIPRMKHLDLDTNIEAINLFENLVRERELERALTIRFESGHVLSGNSLYKPEYQDVLYKEFKPEKLKGFPGRNFDPSKEKPDDWNKISGIRKMRKVKSGDSLFARVVFDPFGLFKPQTDEWYLLCHDQANEVADFIYIEPKWRRIELVHVKGAQGDSESRKISIDAYQVVCQQAVKNLRHLEAKNLYQRFKGYIEGNLPPREAGMFLVSPSSGPDKYNVDIDCTGFIEGLKKLKKGLPVIRKKVVVFQPHIRKSLWDDVVEKFENSENPGDDSTLRPAFMLSTILIETEIACRKLGVDFEVWCEDDKKLKKKATMG